MGITWLKWGEYTIKVEDNNIMKRGQQWEANWVAHKVAVSIPALDLFLHPRITPFCIFSLTYSCTCLELFPRGQCMTWLKMNGYYSLHGNGCNLLTEIVVYDD
jgi:hypothetical protein